MKEGGKRAEGGEDQGIFLYHNKRLYSLRDS